MYIAVLNRRRMFLLFNILPTFSVRADIYDRHAYPLGGSDYSGSVPFLGLLAALSISLLLYPLYSKASLVCYISLGDTRKTNKKNDRAKFKRTLGD